MSCTLAVDFPDFLKEDMTLLKLSPGEGRTFDEFMSHDNTHQQAVEERITEHFKRQLHRSRSCCAPKWVSWRVHCMLIACGRLGGRTDLCPYGMVG